MNSILAIPLEVRLILLFFAGALCGALANLAVYGLAWRRRPISPWMRPYPPCANRRWFDRVPIFGWLALRREAAVHGRGFWIRPMLVELLCALGLALLYVWEVQMLGEYPLAIASTALPASLPRELHVRFLAHAVLFWLMLVASLIDVDEKIIPDSITRPGTLLGLFLLALWPQCLLPDVFMQPWGGWTVNFLDLGAPNQCPLWLCGEGHVGSLLIGAACWVLWCLAIMPRTWYVRHGRLRALCLCCARLFRQADTYFVSSMCLLGLLFITGVWIHDQQNWRALMSALVGMSAGAGMIWLVRIIGTAVLGQEAMGFGDVTLMAMIGAFLGWQSCLIIFFLAPFAALVVGLPHFFLWREREIPYGPFLCLAAGTMILCFRPIWDYACGIFALGWLIAVAMLACLALMIPLLLLVLGLALLYMEH
ncbi:MAG: prepilin peptidase, partial [Thermoguttaceae bacterium]